jgi:Fur family ferric uptake transcriptional regulator/Fur family peroxide stress response transcriptional regulator
MASATETLDQELAGLLRSRGHRVTPQRLVLHRVLRCRDRHLTAEEAMRELGQQLPNVSLPTVYATLELFEGLGLVRRVAMEGGPALFDSRTEDHNHVTCRSCGRIEDIEVPVDDARMRRAARAAGYEPEHTDVVVVGLCSRCRA